MVLHTINIHARANRVVDCMIFLPLSLTSYIKPIISPPPACFQSCLSSVYIWLYRNVLVSYTIRVALCAYEPRASVSVSESV